MRKSLVLLGILDDSDVEWMLRTGVKRRVAASERLVVQGLPIEHLYVVLDGSLSVMLTDGHPVAPLLAGDVVGEMSFIDARPPSATVVAQETSWILAIPKAGVQERLDEDQGFAARFYRAIALFLSLRMRETASRLGWGQARQEADDSDEIPEDLLGRMSIAAHRFGILQERARASA